MSLEETEECKNCGTLPISDFYTYDDESRKGGIRYRCKKCAKKQIKTWSKNHREKKISYYKNYRVNLRWQILCHYSNSAPPSCACCGENIKEFLCIDHIAGGGTQHRLKVGKNMYQWIKRNNYPPMFRVLCYNCNASLGSYGYCPHHSLNKD
jgi:hypothetical protein